MKAVIPCLPLVGLVIGLVWYGVAWGLAALATPLFVRSAALLFVPFVMSGFIHADGYMDTADAVFSRRDVEEKKRILKDPHAGAFAVIAIISLLIFQFCAVHTVVESQKSAAPFILIPVISRCIAGTASLALKPAFETGYNAMFKPDAPRRGVMIICVLAALCFIMAWLVAPSALLPLCAGAAAGFVAAAYLYKQFRGMSGDLSGAIVTVSEFAALLCMALV